MPVFLAILVGLVGIAVAALLIAFVIYPLFKYTFKGVGWLIAHVWAFVAGMATSGLRAIGAVIASILFLPLILANIIIGRWSAASHFGRGLQNEIATLGRSLYRFFIGHPGRFLMLTPALEGLERSIPEAVAQSPGSDKPSRRTGQFEGYTIVGSLRGGGSGGRLFIAEPDERKRAIFARRGVDVGQVVIKSFSLADGSSLPQIIRESRALESARKMGLILEHELTDKRFFYAMPYVPGDMLSVVTHRLHERSAPSGLSDEALREGVGYCADLLETLDVYHRGGLWHKDVKPDNIIVSEGRAHLVDLGLVTPLRSAMTLTTHGTEYFRDPEMVRMALKGVKVHEVNGAKFDIFAAGAVMYSVIERSFPAHGGLSQVSKRCPEALRWIIRRAMTDYDKRYESSAQMLEDVRFVMRSGDAFAVRPADLPSMRGGFVMPTPVEEEPLDPVPAPAQAVAAAYTPRPRPEPQPQAQAQAQAARPAGARPRIVVTDWLTGRFSVVGDTGPAPVGAAPRRGAPAPRVARAVAVSAGGRRSASDQLASARARVQAARGRAAKRMGGRALRHTNYSSGPNYGVAIAVFLFLGACVGVTALVIAAGMRKDGRAVVVAPLSPPREPGIPVEAQELARLAKSGRLSVDVDGVIRDAMTKVAQVSEAAEAFSHMPEWSAMPGVEGRWALINDTANASEPALAMSGAVLASALMSAGATVVGPGDDESEIETVASARAALGVLTADDEAAADRLRAWLNGAGAGHTGVIWLTRNDGAAAPRALVVAQDPSKAAPVAALCDAVLDGEPGSAAPARPAARRR